MIAFEKPVQSSLGWMKQKQRWATADATNNLFITNNLPRFIFVATDERYAMIQMTPANAILNEYDS